jgi:Sugar (and other) transporter
MASGAASSVGYIFGFLANKTHFSLVGGLTLAGTFYVYVCVSLTATVLFYIFMPETEGRTLLEIGQHFAGHRYNFDFFFPNRNTNFLHSTDRLTGNREIPDTR